MGRGSASALVSWLPGCGEISWEGVGQTVPRRGEEEGGERLLSSPNTAVVPLCARHKELPRPLLAERGLGAGGRPTEAGSELPTPHCIPCTVPAPGVPSPPRSGPLFAPSPPTPPSFRCSLQGKTPAPPRDPPTFVPWWGTKPLGTAQPVLAGATCATLVPGGATPAGPPVPRAVRVPAAPSTGCACALGGQQVSGHGQGPAASRYGGQGPGGDGQ